MRIGQLTNKRTSPSENRTLAARTMIRTAPIAPFRSRQTDPGMAVTPARKWSRVASAALVQRALRNAYQQAVLDWVFRLLLIEQRFHVLQQCRSRMWPRTRGRPKA